LLDATVLVQAVQIDKVYKNNGGACLAGQLSVRM
jgi:hypothetical protein